ncbi:MAG TPA: hypothetical protein VLJ57_06865 [Burkholderiaceae bacterium]|nr:hypothetical protein [Burkholderiaceae bacterium]
MNFLDWPARKAANFLCTLVLSIAASGSASASEPVIGGTGQGNVVTQGAELLAKDRVSVSGNAVDLQAVDNTRDSTYHMDSKSIVVGARPAGALGAIINQATEAYEGSKNGASDRLVSANALKAGYDAYKFANKVNDMVAAGDLEGAADKIGEGIGVQVYFGVSKSSQDSESQSSRFFALQPNQ